MAPRTFQMPSVCWVCLDNGSDSAKMNRRVLIYLSYCWNDQWCVLEIYYLYHSGAVLAFTYKTKIHVRIVKAISTGTKFGELECHSVLSWIEIRWKVCDWRLTGSRPTSEKRQFHVNRSSSIIHEPFPFSTLEALVRIWSEWEQSWLDSVSEYEVVIWISVVPVCSLLLSPFMAKIDGLCWCDVMCRVAKSLTSGARVKTPPPKLDSSH